MNFSPLYETARVITAIYRIASTIMLLIYLAFRVMEGRVYRRKEARRFVRGDYQMV